MSMWREVVLLITAYIIYEVYVEATISENGAFQMTSANRYRILRSERRQQPFDNRTKIRSNKPSPVNNVETTKTTSGVQLRATQDNVITETSGPHPQASTPKTQDNIITKTSSPQPQASTHKIQDNITTTSGPHPQASTHKTQDNIVTTTSGPQLEASTQKTQDITKTSGPQSPTQKTQDNIVTTTSGPQLGASTQKTQENVNVNNTIVRYRPPAEIHKNKPAQVERFPHKNSNNFRSNVEEFVFKAVSEGFLTSQSTFLVDDFNTLNTRQLFQNQRYIVAKKESLSKGHRVLKTITRLSPDHEGSPRSPETQQVTANFSSSCIHIVTALLAFSDSRKYNIDWIFYLTGQFNKDWYKAKYDVIEALMTLHLPYVPAEDGKLRKAATADACRASVPRTPFRSRYDPDDNGPYSVVGLFYISSLNRFVKPFDGVPGDYANIVSKCRDALSDWLLYCDEVEIPFEDMVKRLFGFNPHFSLSKLCTIGLHVLARAAREARERYYNTDMIELPYLNFTMRIPNIADVEEDEKLKQLVELYRDITEFKAFNPSK